MTKYRSGRGRSALGTFFWLLRVGWIVTLLPWAFFAFGSLITHADDSFILWYPVALLAFIVPAEVLRAKGNHAASWIIGVVPLLPVALILSVLFSGPSEGFMSVSREGPYTEYYDSGQIKAEGTWVRHAATSSFHNHTDQERSRAHAANDGHRTTWYPNGQKASEGEFIDGEETGAWTTWHPNGQVSSQGNYVSRNAGRGNSGSRKGEKIGAWTTWHANGVKASEEVYGYETDEGGFITFDGMWTTWYENGERQTEKVFAGNHNYRERETTWRENGRKWDETIYQDGRPELKIAWNESGQKSNEIRYVDGLVDLRTRWSDSGKIREQSRYADGSKTSYTTWFENGQKSLEETFANARRDGFRATWYENGQPKFRADYVGGELAGPLVEWDEDGTKVFEMPVDSQTAAYGDGNPYCYGTPNGLDDWLPKGNQTTQSLASELRKVLGNRYSQSNERNKYHCFLLDACSGGRGRSRNDFCFKWAESAEGEAISWVE